MAFERILKWTAPDGQTHQIRVQWQEDHQQGPFMIGPGAPPPLGYWLVDHASVDRLLADVAAGTRSAEKVRDLLTQVIEKADADDRADHA